MSVKLFEPFDFIMNSLQFEFVRLKTEYATWERERESYTLQNRVDLLLYQFRNNTLGTGCCVRWWSPHLNERSSLWTTCVWNSVSFSRKHSCCIHLKLTLSRLANWWTENSNSNCIIFVLELVSFSCNLYTKSLYIMGWESLFGTLLKWWCKLETWILNSTTPL